MLCYKLLEQESLKNLKKTKNGVEWKTGKEEVMKRRKIMFDHLENLFCYL